MVESVVVGICLDKVCECITDFIGAHSCVSDAPAQFHSSVDLVDAATTGLLPSATVGVPVAFLADKFYALLVLHLEVTDAYVAHIQHRNEPTHDDTHFSNFAGQHQMMKYTAGTPTENRTRN